MLGKTASIREQKTRQADNREGQFDYSPEVNP